MKIGVSVGHQQKKIVKKQEPRTKGSCKNKKPKQEKKKEEKEKEREKDKEVERRKKKEGKEE